MARILGAARLSHSTDNSTSLERQHESIEMYGKLGNHIVVEITEDSDVSGAVSPFDRPELGPWLNEKLDQWDMIVVTKLDRLSRSLIDLETFVRWLKLHGKTLVSVSENIDLSTSMGKVFVQLLGIFAEFERTRMAERRAEAAAKIRSNGFWGGGQALPYGYRPVKMDGHFELEIDPDQAAVMRELAAAVIGGKSMRAACIILNERGIATAKGARWDVATVANMLRNPSLRGYTMHSTCDCTDKKHCTVPEHKPEPMAGEDGMPLAREAVLDDATWHDLQAALERNSRKDSGVRNDGALLLRVLYHGDDPLYMHRRPGRGDRYRTGPKAQRSASFRAEVIESMVTGALLSNLGNLPMRRLEVEPAVSHAAELARVAERIDSLEAQFFAGAVSAELFGRMAGKLETRQAELREAAKNDRPPTPHYAPTGQTFAQFWDSLDDDERRHTFLLDNRVTARIWRGQADEPLPDHTAEVYDDATRYTVRVTFTALATLLDVA
jgi:site-specific DNA recombinase